MLEAQKQNLSHLLGKPSCPVDYCLSILAGNYPTVQKKEARFLQKLLPGYYLVGVAVGGCGCYLVGVLYGFLQLPVM